NKGLTDFFVFTTVKDRILPYSWQRFKKNLSLLAFGYFLYGKRAVTVVTALLEKVFCYLLGVAKTI
ncbi:MAG: hypothetical protein Q4B70_12420, partial [Lachnospiraceae bacterium]|nr:hypothetical protein [Lachnospiraceae bacterium]